MEGILFIALEKCIQRASCLLLMTMEWSQILAKGTCLGRGEKSILLLFGESWSLIDYDRLDVITQSSGGCNLSCFSHSWFLHRGISSLNKLQSNILRRVYSHNVKMVGVVSSDSGWNNPRTLRSKASYLEVLVVLKTAS
eukprot:scaffold62636_cov52-Attheya_sp.AAC.10